MCVLNSLKLEESRRTTKGTERDKQLQIFAFKTTGLEILGV